MPDDDWDDDRADPPADVVWDEDDRDDLEGYFLKITRGYTPRKRRLFLCACCQLGVEHSDTLSTALAVAERYADGSATDEELEKARDVSWAVGGAATAKACYPTDGSWFDSALGVMSYLVDPNEPGDPWKPYRDILRCVFGNPHRVVRFKPSWRTPTVSAVAARMYDEKDFAAMPILADALQEAGCEEPDVLCHCRSRGPHVRGCWVVDHILLKD
jgi:hypothetical protein